MQKNATVAWNSGLRQIFVCFLRVLRFVQDRKICTKIQRKLPLYIKS